MNLKLWKITKWSSIFLFIIIVWAIVFGFSSTKPGFEYNKNTNAVWISHKWAGKYHGRGEVQGLVNTLKSIGVNTVFVHVGPLEKDGTIPPDRYMYAIDFLEKARLIDQTINYQAWIGQIRGKIGLSDKNVRKNVSELCMKLTYFNEFDGIHFDIEPVWDGDYAFIQTLEECRAKIKDGSKISVALAEFIPKSFIWLAGQFKEFKNYNTEINYRNVAKHADSIVVMTYDTSFKKSWIYKLFVKEETIRVTRLLKDTEVFIGIPAYKKPNDAFDPLVENLENGLKGIISGLKNTRSRVSSFAGVAIYPFWELNQNDIKTYQKLWLNK